MNRSWRESILCREEIRFSLHCLFKSLTSFTVYFKEQLTIFLLSFFLSLSLSLSLLIVISSTCRELAKEEEEVEEDSNVKIRY